MWELYSGNDVSQKKGESIQVKEKEKRMREIGASQCWRSKARRKEGRASERSGKGRE